MARGTSSTPSAAPKDYLIPGILFVAGVVIFLIYGFLLAGSAGVRAMVSQLPLAICSRIVFGVIACLITARIKKEMEFGSLSSAAVKIAAVSVFPASVTFFIPWVGWVFALALHYKLLRWLFELEIDEAVILAFVIWGVTLVGVLLLAHLGLSA